MSYEKKSIKNKKFQKKIKRNEEHLCDVYVDDKCIMSGIFYSKGLGIKDNLMKNDDYKKSKIEVIKK